MPPWHIGKTGSSGSVWRLIVTGGLKVEYQHHI